jgi:hypothetical protein
MAISPEVPHEKEESSSKTPDRTDAGPETFSGPEGA